MSRVARSLLIAVVGGAALIVISLIGFVLWSRANSQTIIGSVSVSGTDLSGLEKTEAEALLAALESEQAQAVIEILVEDYSISFSAAEFGYRINTGQLIDLALWQERSGSFLQRWRRWLRNFYSEPTPVEFRPQSSIDETRVMDLLDQLDHQYGKPPVEGKVEFLNGLPIPTYPTPGWRLDRTDTVERITAAAMGGGGTVPMSSVLVEPLTRIDQITDALTTAQIWISAPVVFKDPAGEADLIFTAQEIADATTFGFDINASPTVSLRVDPRLVTRKVAEISDRVGDAPRDAYYEIDENNQVIIHPSRSGTVIDVTKTGELLEQLAAGETRSATLPIAEGVQAQITTEEIEMLGIRHLVSQYTTYHPCCAARVSNIQLFADKVNDALVPPGERFSLNQHVGRRTFADGFVQAGTLVKGELVDTVGGGVSQFATTFYNAVFWGGFEDIFHKTHSFYFPRYPVGVEATINWPEVDLVFRNDSPAHVLIRTEYTRTSITVKFFGDNDGRIVVGSWQDGRGRLEVVAEGGPNTRIVSSSVSGRFNQKEPPETLYRANPEVVIGEVEQVQSSAPGWDVNVTRIIRRGEEETRHANRVRYLPRREIIEVHPCVMSLLTDSGAVAPPDPSETPANDSPTGDDVVCPGPEDEEPTILPEGLHDSFPELIPEEEDQTPIDEEGGEPDPTTDGSDGQAPISDGQAPIDEEGGDPDSTTEEDDEPPSDTEESPAPSEGNGQ